MSVNIEEIVGRILAELRREGYEPKEQSPERQESVISRDGTDLVIDLADPTLDRPRHAMLVEDAQDPDGLRNLMASTNARLGVGRAGPRPKTGTALLFQADHGVTQDAIYGVVSDEARDAFNLFTVTSRVADRAEYLLRPDLGRLLSDESKAVIAEKCVKSPDVQLCVVDGLSAAAIDNNLRDIYPVIEQGLKAAGLTVGTPFFVENGRVGIMNDINALVKAKVVVLLIGERPGLGIADAMSAYMGFDPQPGKSDADRDLICMITTHGGTNPLEAGAYIVEFIKRMIKYSASGVKLREVAGE
ncbi:ethanolamine ammonia-lyase [Tessaracoccus aquimaris]|uniref:Ethanolamine ammonia-lyase small subunit n=1 Tax=Tessaracoccus aquimaris TaxID=1332264 RepID=A0A1Q2CMW9_9ACTN|nr:ethanolamine ammonia-lyase subunit EutC [Tessaracoccus aquimaris]AQP47457.1 ethanolamine ammonia-lyase [Tessaracoccus aquimaris]